MNFAEWNVWVLAGVFAVATAVVWFAGTHLARLADAVSAKTGIGQAAMGMVLLGGITSSPELAVAVTATLQDAPMLSINDVLGSAAINILVLAIADVAIGRGPLTARVPSLSVVMQGVMGIAMFALVAAGTYVSEAAFLGVGIGSWLLVLTYGIAIRLLVNSHVDDAWRPTDGQQEENGSRKESRSLGKLVALISAAGVAILVAGFLLARTGEALAEQTGLGTSFFGAVILAFATSTPEISTVLEAVRLRRYTMAISDVFGTNLFNVLIIFVVDAMYRGGPVLVEAGPFAATAALLAMLLTSIYLIGMLERRDRAVLRMGYDTLAVLIVYIAGLFALYAQRP
jgi:cation:H+ antiporter